MAVSPLLPVIDYTSRDYEAIRTDLIRLIRARIPTWSAENPSDFGVAMVEAFAYAVDGLHYYLDRVANEAYLPTAVQRESLYAIAEMFNYTPRRATPAEVYLTFSNATQAEVSIPAGTRVQASVPGQSGAMLKNFEVQFDTLLPAGSATAESVISSVMALEGRTYSDESIGVSNGFVGQQFFLPRTSVLDGSIRVNVQLGDVTTEWAEVPVLMDANPTDKVFEAMNQTDGSCIVRFGDGLHGAVPPLHSIVRATYRVGGGTSGNVPANSINTIIEPVIYGVSVTNEDPATGGANAESLESIRINAARAYRSRDRAVTLADYQAVAITGVPLVAKAKPVGNNGSSVTVYVAPQDDGSKRPPLSPEQADEVRTYLEQRAMAGVTVQVFGAAFVPIFLTMQVYCLPTARQDEVEKAIKDQLDFYFRYQNVDFNQTVTVQTIYSQLSTIQGLDYVQITRLSLAAGDPDIETIVLNQIAVNAIPFFSSDGVVGADSVLTLTVQGGIA
jgi:uncharacterized phage protein gp47/JayE